MRVDMVYPSISMLSAALWRRLQQICGGQPERPLRISFMFVHFDLIASRAAALA
jgi:hypothetical protein